MATLERVGDLLKASWPAGSSDAAIVGIRDDQQEWIILTASASSGICSVNIKGPQRAWTEVRSDQLRVRVDCCRSSSTTIGDSFKMTGMYRARVAEQSPDELAGLLNRQLTLQRTATPTSATLLRGNTFHTSGAVEATPTVTLTAPKGMSIPTLPSDVGVRVQENKMLAILKRGTVLPATDSRTVLTAVDYQTSASVCIYYGDNQCTNFNTLVDDIPLDGITPRKKHEVEISLKLTVDVNGFFSLKAKELNTCASTAWHKFTSPNPIPIKRKAQSLHSAQLTQLAVTVKRCTYTQASVIWSQCSPRPDRWLIAIRTDSKDSDFLHIPIFVCQQLKGNKNCCYFVVDGATTQFEFPLQFVAGRNYQVAVRALVACEPTRAMASARARQLCGYRVVGQGSSQFRAELTLDDLNRLHQMALRNCNSFQVTPCVWLYRNRWPEYFNEIFQKHSGIMEVYIKDNSGDQASPINGQIHGLFFMAKNIDGRPPPDSPFGQIRIQIPADVLFDIAPNLYFADFYCMRGKLHYVTLVMTKTGSSADVYCREKLLALDLYDSHANPFLFRRGQQLYVNNTYYILVELFYTEDINIVKMVREEGAKYLQNIPTVGRGRSTPGGIPKNAACRTCNLPVSHSYQQEPF